MGQHAAGSHPHSHLHERARALSCRQVYDRTSRIKPKRRRTEKYGPLGPFTYWDLHDFAALLGGAAAFLYGGFRAGVRLVPEPPTDTRIMRLFEKDPSTQDWCWLQRARCSWTPFCPPWQRHASLYTSFHLHGRPRVRKGHAVYLLHNRRQIRA